jgi:hypothetical protein
MAAISPARKPENQVAPGSLKAREAPLLQLSGALSGLHRTMLRH